MGRRKKIHRHRSRNDKLHMNIPVVLKFSSKPKRFFLAAYVILTMVTKFPIAPRMKTNAAYAQFIVRMN